ncbi:hypothetical protein FRC08_004795 [Ceratobasidium sp. 394]|nr:hypothetical protein FRC08_004795 [Ceratobasidium sp. 394]
MRLYLFVLSLCTVCASSWPLSVWPWSSTSALGAWANPYPELTDLSFLDTQSSLTSASEGWHDPADGGGRMLDYTTIFWGEPLNVIISGNSHPDVLTHQGLHKYAKSIGFSEECLGIHIGDIHSADLGDGEGRKDEQFLARQHYFPIWGTCWESLAGGNHFRAWRQRDTGAWFLACVPPLCPRRDTDLTGAMRHSGFPRKSI